MADQGLVRAIVSHADSQKPQNRLIRLWAVLECDPDHPRMRTLEIDPERLPSCEHPVSLPIKVKVLGEWHAFRRLPVQDWRICASCLEDWLNKFSTRCVVCRGPILPLQAISPEATVGTWPTRRRGYAHASCAGGNFDGCWGEGRPISIYSEDAAVLPLERQSLPQGEGSHEP